MTQETTWLDAIHFDDSGLLPAIAQDFDTGDVLMVAWMNAESLRMTLDEGRMVYWSRSRQELWRKGDTSGDLIVEVQVTVPDKLSEEQEKAMKEFAEASGLKY